jgi:hypothetical protein
LSEIMKILLAENLRGRSLNEKVIPTVCNLKNMLAKLDDLNGDYIKLKGWEKRSYQAYLIDVIQTEILHKGKQEKIENIRKNILKQPPTLLGASCIDIYLVAYVAESYGVGKDIFFEYVKKSRITSKDNSAQAIWQVGKGDGVYLGILNNDGSVKDWDFIKSWVGSS